MTDPTGVRASTILSEETAPARLLIMGLGNSMMADDGIGHAVVEHLGCCDLPKSVRLAAIDDDVLALTRLWKGERAVWIVDAVSSDCPAGTRHLFEHHQLLHLPAGGLSVHHPSVGESLRWIQLARPEMRAVAFRLYGVEVGVVRPEPGLTDAVTESVTRLVGDITFAARQWAASSGGGQWRARGRSGEATSS
jgi:hydrogenase maturation protease